MQRHLLILCALALAACGKEHKPASYVDKLRILAIRAETPELFANLVHEDGATSRRGLSETNGVVIRPARELDRTTLTALVADPLQLEDAEREAMVVYLACTPEPGNLEPGLCSLIETYADPTQLPQLLQRGGGACEGGAAGAIGEGKVGGISIAGVERCDHELGCSPAEIEFAGTPLALPPPTYILPEGFTLEGLPPGHPQRTKGVQILVIAVAVVATPEELFEGADPADPCAFSERMGANLGRLLETRERLTALKRIQVRGPDNQDVRNFNPEIAGLVANGAALPTSLEEPVQAEARFRASAAVALHPLQPAGEDGEPVQAHTLYQAFTRYDSEGRFFREEQEAWLWSWFTTAGEFDGERTRNPLTPRVWTAPSGKPNDPIPAGGRVFLYGVVRDARGGIAWTKHEVRVEP